MLLSTMRVGSQVTIACKPLPQATLLEGRYSSHLFDKGATPTLRRPPIWYAHLPLLSSEQWSHLIVYATYLHRLLGNGHGFFID